MKRSNDGRTKAQFLILKVDRILNFGTGKLIGAPLMAERGRPANVAADTGRDTEAATKSWIARG